MRVLSVLLVLATLPAILPAQETAWRTKVDTAIPLFGHRNWIVVADAAYPAQTRDGIETVVTGANHFEVLRYVLSKLEESKHITPILWTDAELKFVPDADAPGVSALRDRMAAMLHDKPMQTMLHEKIIAELDKAGQTFKVLVLKTTMTLPYTSVFLQLDCAYWGQEAERRMRESMKK